MTILKVSQVKLKAPSGSTEASLKGFFDVIFGTTLLVAALPLISAASS